MCTVADFQFCVNWCVCAGLKQGELNVKKDLYCKTFCSPTIILHNTLWKKHICLKLLCFRRTNKNQKHCSRYSDCTALWAKQSASKRMLLFGKERYLPPVYERYGGVQKEAIWMKSHRDVFHPSGTPVELRRIKSTWKLTTYETDKVHASPAQMAMVQLMDQLTSHHRYNEVRLGKVVCREEVVNKSYHKQPPTLKHGRMTMCPAFAWLKRFVRASDFHLFATSASVHLVPSETQKSHVESVQQKNQSSRCFIRCSVIYMSEAPVVML